MPIKHGMKKTSRGRQTKARYVAQAQKGKYGIVKRKTGKSYASLRH